MRRVNSSMARANFSETLNAALSEPLEITRRNAETVVLISKKEYDAIKKEALNARLEYLFVRHAETLRALADR